jgi:putative transposase
LYQQIGQLKVELDWLKKKLPAGNDCLRKLIEPAHEQICIQRQCELVGLVRSMWYYQPKPESPEDLHLMKLLDEKYMERPYFGVLRMTEWLKKKLKEQINPKHVRRLLRKMGLMALYPKRNLSKPSPGHKIYKYLLRGLTILRPNQVWSTDVTYIRLAQGFVYLVAIIDWHSRYVLSWGLSVTLESNFCVEALDQAILLHGKPDIFNSDQGSQFTSTEFTDRLKAEGIRISMDGRGRALDNIFVERLWRSVKYEEVYLHDYSTVTEAILGLKKYFLFYNTERQHQSLDYQTPQEVYEGQAPDGIRILCAA